MTDTQPSTTIEEIYRTFGSAQSARTHFVSRGCQCSAIQRDGHLYSFTRTAMQEELTHAR
jgi:hypothetical protein